FLSLVLPRISEGAGGCVHVWEDVRWFGAGSLSQKRPARSGRAPWPAAPVPARGANAGRQGTAARGRGGGVGRRLPAVGGRVHPLGGAGVHRERQEFDAPVLHESLLPPHPPQARRGGGLARQPRTRL